MIASLLCYTSINLYGANLQKSWHIRPVLTEKLHKELQISRKSTKKGQLRLPQGFVDLSDLGGKEGAALQLCEVL